MSIAQSVLQGNRLAIARLLTWVENDTKEGRQALSELFRSTGQAHLIGITGAPGTGKSSLVNQVVLSLRRSLECESNGTDAEKPSVAVIAVDPSSPFTGGAILGDRIRMRDLSGDPGIFIRSMASRGSLGGLAWSTAGAVQVLDAAGFNLILIETVGVGQAEVDIAKLAHTTVVIESPGLGDDIQAIKAGILEIADILVVNKADLAGVEATERALRGTLQLGFPLANEFQSHHGKSEKKEDGVAPVIGASVINSPANSQESPRWVPPIHKTVATNGRGIAELIDSIERHREYLQKSGLWQDRERKRLEAEVKILLQETLVINWRESISDQLYEIVLQDVFARKISPHNAVEVLLEAIKN